MAQFTATAKHSFSLDGGGRVERGETVTLRSTEMGMRAASLFSSDQRRAAARMQMAAQGIVGIKDQHLSTGTWDVKESR